MTDVVTTDGLSADDLLRLAASAERGSEHPLGEAIVQEVQGRGLSLAEAEQFQAVPGHGIEARVEDRRLVLGNMKLMQDRRLDLNGLTSQGETLSQQGKTPMFVAVDGQVAGVIAVADTVKPGARAAVDDLHRMGLEVVMLTGDNPVTAEAITGQGGVDRELAEVLQEEKVENVRALQP